MTHAVKSAKMFGDVRFVPSSLLPSGFAVLINFPEVNSWFLKVMISLSVCVYVGERDVSQVSEVLFSQSPLHSCLRACVAYLVFGLFLDVLPRRRRGLETS